jgi:hypothetical protein
MENSYASKLKSYSWARGNYLISTDHTLIPVPEVNAMFAALDVYWTSPVPEDVLAETLKQSLCFGLFRLTPSASTSTKPERELIGFARCVTDYTTFMYLTDVHVWPAHRGSNLGSWLISCVKETVDSMPHLRQLLLFTSNWTQSVPFYESLLDAKVFEGKRGEGFAVLLADGRGKVKWET